ncbi:beta-galactosidase [Caulobacter sp. X]|uniref:beta-galactosidase n=1 Tax=Caulobacter sp. X TaxID=2048901 RepID=UPI001177DCBF|nr:beta-galactosidase [Caulobacter sp. X]
MALLMGLSALALVSASPVLAQVSAGGATVLEGFEGVGAVKITGRNADAKMVAVHASEGRQSLQVTYGPKVENTLTLTPATPWDLTGRGDVNLAFDIYNPGSVSTQFFFTLTDASGRGQRRTGVIAAGASVTFYAPLTGYEGNVITGLRENPPGWQSKDQKLFWRNGDRAANMAQIKSISFETEALTAPRTLYIDNVRVRQSPPADPFFLTEIVDRWGQAAKEEYPVKIHSDAELKKAAKMELAELAASKGAPERSRFGGWAAGPKLKATGFFRTEKVNGKWWLVDPEGYLFFSSGIANVRMANLETITGYDFGDPAVRKIDPEELTPEDSRDIVPVPAASVGTRFLSSTLRRNMFQWLPTYEEPLGEAYGYRRTLHQGAVEHGEVYSFYKANLQRRYGAGYMQTWRQVTLDRMKDWGMTSFGNWIDPMYYDNQQMPYFANGWIIGKYKTLSSGNDYWAPLPDVYDPEFKRRARLTIEQVGREVKSSPWCVGVFIDNEKSWGLTDSVAHQYGAVLDALSKSTSDSPAKAAFSRMLRGKYKSIAALNAAWKTSFGSWDEFDAGVRVAAPEAAQPDLSWLFADYADTYFRTVREEIRRVLPNQLYMGVRMAEWGMPSEVTQAAVKYSDVLSYNIYREELHPESWGFLNKLDRPTIVGEFHIGSATDTGLYNPGLVLAVDQKDRGRMYEIYMNSVLANPMMVGAHWFQYIDDNVTGRAYDGENYNVGWVTNTDIPYPEMRDAAKRFNYTLYSRRYGKTK